MLVALHGFRSVGVGGTLSSGCTFAGTLLGLTRKCTMAEHVPALFESISQELVYCRQLLKLPAHISSDRAITSILNNSLHRSISLSRLTAACSARIPSWTLSRRHPRRSCLWWQCLPVSRRRQSEKKCVSDLSLEGLEWRSLTGMLPFTADLALSVKLWPP